MTYQESFLRFMVDCGVLTFGEFTLKSGRKAPYFINAGNYHTGAQLLELGRYYAACMEAHHVPVETVFGPAYKGIPLAAAAAMAMADQYHKDVNFCYDRKEVKDHGEGGMFVGKKLTDGEKVVIIEDVMTGLCNRYHGRYYSGNPGWHHPRKGTPGCNAGIPGAVRCQQISVCDILSLLRFLFVRSSLFSGQMFL